MPDEAKQEVTELLRKWSGGDTAALEELTPLIYAELHRIAQNYMRRERAGHTLQTSALVNEAYLRLINCNNVEWQNRAHFFGVSANLMRRILVDFARRRPQSKEGKMHQISLDEALTVTAHRSADLVALDEALNRLQAWDERKAKIVEMKFFGGLSVEETAEVLQISGVTVMREWARAKAWLFKELSEN